MVNSRKAKKPITVMKMGEVLIEDVDTIKNHILQYYTPLFQSSINLNLVDLFVVSQVIPTLVGDHENVLLIVFPNPDEVQFFFLIWTRIVLLILMDLVAPFIVKLGST